MALPPMEIPHPEYRVWALDDVIYGPVPIDSLRAWIRDERIHSGSWIFCERTRRWQQAGDIPGLRALFYVPESDVTAAAADEVRPALLRRVRVLSELSEEQIAIFIQYGSLVHFPAFTTIMKQGSSGDSLFLVIEATSRIIHPQPIENSLLALVVMCISLFAAICLVIYQRTVVAKTGSLAVAADQTHYFGDIATNVGVVLAIVLFCSVIGIPFGLQHIKLAMISLAPVGITIEES